MHSGKASWRRRHWTCFLKDEEANAEMGTGSSPGSVLMARVSMCLQIMEWDRLRQCEALGHLWVGLECHGLVKLKSCVCCQDNMPSLSWQRGDGPADRTVVQLACAL